MVMRIILIWKLIDSFALSLTSGSLLIRRAAIGTPTVITDQLARAEAWHAARRSFVFVISCICLDIQKDLTIPFYSNSCKLRPIYQNHLWMLLILAECLRFGSCSHPLRPRLEPARRLRRQFCWYFSNSSLVRWKNGKLWTRKKKTSLIRYEWSELGLQNFWRISRQVSCQVSIPLLKIWLLSYEEKREDFAKSVAKLCPGEPCECGAHRYLAKLKRIRECQIWRLKVFWAVSISSEAAVVLPNERINRKLQPSQWESHQCSFCGSW